MLITYTPISVLVMGSTFMRHVKYSMIYVKYVFTITSSLTSNGINLVRRKTMRLIKNIHTK